MLRGDAATPWLDMAIDTGANDSSIAEHADGNAVRIQNGDVNVPALQREYAQRLQT